MLPLLLPLLLLPTHALLKKTPPRPLLLLLLLLSLSLLPLGLLLLLLLIQTRPLLLPRLLLLPAARLLLLPVVLRQRPGALLLLRQMPDPMSSNQSDRSARASRPSELRRAPEQPVLRGRGLSQRRSRCQECGAMAAGPARAQKF